MKIIAETTFDQGGGCEIRVRLRDDGSLTIVEVNGPDLDTVDIADADALCSFLAEYGGARKNHDRR